jgi:transcriptional regulator with XRE-family HTH domain
MSQEDLAHDSGLSRRHVWGLEHEEDDPTLSTLRRMRTGFGMTLEQLAAVFEEIEKQVAKPKA